MYQMAIWANGCQKKRLPGVIVMAAAFGSGTGVYVMPSVRTAGLVYGMVWSIHRTAKDARTGRKPIVAYGLTGGNAFLQTDAGGSIPMDGFVSPIEGAGVPGAFEIDASLLDYASGMLWARFYVSTEFGEAIVATPVLAVDQIEGVSYIADMDTDGVSPRFDVTITGLDALPAAPFDVTFQMRERIYGGPIIEEWTETLDPADAVVEDTGPTGDGYKWEVTSAHDMTAINARPQLAGILANAYFFVNVAGESAPFLMDWKRVGFGGAPYYYEAP